jgi:hypothetical protein
LGFEAPGVEVGRLVCCQWWWIADHREGADRAERLFWWSFAPERVVANSEGNLPGVCVRGFAMQSR